MEVDVAEHHLESEAAHFCKVANEAESPIIGVIAACRPESEEFEPQLDSIEDPALIGLRRVFHVAPEGTLQAPNLIPNLRLVGLRDLTFDLCLRPDQLRQVIPIVDACPHTRFVLDHAGNPPISSDEYPDWEDAIKALAMRPNVACKISGLVNHIPESLTPLVALHPVIDYTAETFGIDRLLFGGDWPVCKLAGFDVDSWVKLLRKLTLAWSDDERNALFEENARRVYG
jgi:predicted TIM-barrel fold metal-dependent hydrolase